MEGFAKIGIDWWGVLLYLINYGVLLMILAKFVYPRILKVIEDRRTVIESNLGDADRLRSELVKQNAQAEKERKALLQKLEEETALIKKDLQDKRKEMLDQIHAEREKMLADARALIDQEKSALISEVQEKLVQVVQAAVLHITLTQVPEETVAASITKGWESFETSV